jgi:hypothetical protein
LTYEEYTGEGMVQHIEKCGYCKYLEEHLHPEECEECEHPWHEWTCVGANGWVVGDCPCECSPKWTRNEVEIEQIRHADEALQDAHEDAMDRKYQEFKDSL